jgi:integrase
MVRRGRTRRPAADGRGSAACRDASRRISCTTPTRLKMAHEGVPLIVIQRHLGHSNLGITSIYLQGVDNAEIIEAVHARRAPMVSVSASLRN